jgi:hypothetical protein
MLRERLLISVSILKLDSRIQLYIIYSTTALCILNTAEQYSRHSLD